MNNSNPIIILVVIDDTIIRNELQRRIGDETTYTEPLERLPEMKPFIKEFYRTIYTVDKKQYYRQQRTENPKVDKLYKKLCGKTVSFEDFWQRYEYRCNYQHIQNELTIAQQQIQQRLQDIEDNDAVPLSPIREEESTSVNNSPGSNNNNTKEQLQWDIENGGLSPTDVKDESQLLMNSSSSVKNKDHHHQSRSSTGIDQDNSHDDDGTTTGNNTSRNIKEDLMGSIMIKTKMMILPSLVLLVDDVKVV